MAADDVSWREALLWSMPDGPLPSPPVTTKAKLLPIGELSWENAERVFLRLLHTQGSVQYAKLFGLPGQKQGGIDAYARLPLDLSQSAAGDRHYLTLQSRRVKKLSPAHIKSAAADFLAGEWSKKSKRFYLATPVDLQERGLDAAVREATDKLADKGVEFVPWGAQELAELLRAHPQIVDDFFGRSWVELFCGREAAERLAHRLTVEDNRALREDMRRLYAAVFAAQGARPRPGSDNEFVILDVTSPTNRDAWDSGTTTDEAQEQPQQAPPAMPEHESLVTRSAFGPPRRSLRPVRRLLDRTDLHEAATGTAADDWLSERRHALLVGPPGSGKSSLLRFVATDLLSSLPQSLALQREYADRLPVWLPFGYLCRHLAESSTHSLNSAVKAWLTQQNAEQLWQLVEGAMADDRLLLLVDGIDEWSDIDAAEHALGVLEAFLGHTQASAVLSTRPYAIGRLNWTLDWSRGVLMPLTSDQRRAIAAQALVYAADEEQDSGTSARIRLEPFLDELEAVPELSELSRSPLFLTLLATTWRGEPLPHQRFKLYDRLVELLIEKHPQMRRRASRARGTTIPPNEFVTLFKAVAYRLRLEGHSGPVERAEMRRHVYDVLADDGILGYPQAEARRIADAVLAVAESEFGLLVSHGAGQVGFVHRVIWDHLAGLHLATLPPPEQAGIVTRRAADPAWRDVLLSALSAHIAPQAVKKLLDSVAGEQTAEGPNTTDIDSATGWPSRAREEAGGYELLAQALASNVVLTPKQQAAYIHELIGRVETHPSLEHRANLVTSLVRASAGQAARAQLLPVFKRWLTAPRPYPAAVMWALGDVPVRDDEAARALLWGLRHPDDQAKIQAALAAAHRFEGQGGMEAKLHHLLRTGPSSSTQAAALYAIGKGWLSSTGTSRAIDWARKQSSYSVRVAALHLLHRGGPGSDLEVFRTEERSWLLGLLEREDRFNSEPWSAMAADLVNLAAAGDQAAADLALETLRSNGRNGGDRSLAWTLACGAFSDDHRFMEWTADQLGDMSERGLPLYNVNMIPQPWSTNPSFNAVQARFVAQELKSGVQPFAVIGLSGSMAEENARAALLAGLDAWRPWSAARALIARFPLDTEVLAALSQRLHGEFKRAAPITPVAIDVLGMEAGFDLLTNLLRRCGEGSNEHQVVVAQEVADAWALIRKTATRANDGTSDDTEARTTAQRIIDRYDPAELSALCTHVSTSGLGWHIPSIIQAWPEQEHVVAYARKALYDSRHITPGIEDLTAPAVLRAHAGREDARSRDLVKEALDLLTHLEAELREVLAFELTRGPLDPSELVDTVANWKTDPDLQVRRTILVGATRYLRTHQSAAQASGSQNLTPELKWLRDQIRTGLCSYGPELEENRQIAWIGMLLLQDLTLIDGLRETIGDPEEPGVELTTMHGEPDPILIDLVAANWTMLREHFGSSIYSRLAGKRTRRRGEEVEVWRVLSPLATVATKYPEIAELLRDCAAGDPASVTGAELDVRRDPNFVLWAKRENRGDLSALSALVDTMESRNNRDHAIVIASLLDLDSWNVSLEEFKTTLAGTGPHWASGRAWALDPAHGQRAVYAQLFPHDPVSVAWYASLVQWFADRVGPGPQSWTDTLAICFGVAAPDDLPVITCRIHERFRHGGRAEDMRLFTSPLIRRLRADPEAAAAMRSPIPAGPMREDSPLFARATDPVAKANSDLARYPRAHLLALVLKQAGHLLPQEATDVTAFLQTADPKLVVNNPFTNEEGPLWLSAMDLLPNP